MGTSMDCLFDADGLLTRLVTPTRNLYFYGKPLDAEHLQLEQSYGNVKRWMLNRLSLGSGVLCGLRVAASSDGTRVRVGPGVAIDGLGREIIVAAPSPPIDPRQPSDPCGRPTGPPVREAGVVTLYLCYHECPAEPAPAMVDHCGPEPTCEYGLVRERYRLQIGRGLPRPPGAFGDEVCAQVFAEPPAGDTRREVLCHAYRPPCDAPEQPCIPIATIELDADLRIVAVDECTFRRTVYSNAVLLDLILCLAARVDQCCGGAAVQSLAIVSGNDQVGLAGEPLASPLVVRVTEGGDPVGAEAVTFDVTSGGGEIGDDPTALGASFATTTAADGTATLPIWRLGPAVGVQRVSARIASGMPAMVVFRATAERVTARLPVIRAVWPPNARDFGPGSNDPQASSWFALWRRSPRIEVTFDREMRQSHIAAPDPWLRMYRIVERGRESVVVLPLSLGHAGRATSPILGTAGVTEIYRVSLPDGGAVFERFLILMRSADGEIVDLSTPPLELDAEFRGTQLTQARLDDLWSLTAERQFGADVWSALIDTGAQLPQSGDGSEGGAFHGWFEVRNG